MNKELAKKMINPHYFTDRALQVGLKISLDSHHINHFNSNITIQPSLLEFEIKPQYINKNLEELSVNYAGLTNQYKFK